MFTRLPESHIYIPHRYPKLRSRIYLAHHPKCVPLPLCFLSEELTPSTQVTGLWTILEATVSTSHWLTSRPLLSSAGSASQIHPDSGHFPPSLCHHPSPSSVTSTWVPGIAFLLLSRHPSWLLIHCPHSSWVDLQQMWIGSWWAHCTWNENPKILNLVYITPLRLYFLMPLYLCRAAVTECHKPGHLYNRNLLSHSSGGWHSDVKVWRALASSEAVERESAPGPCLWLLDGHLHVLLCACLSPKFLLSIETPVILG